MVAASAPPGFVNSDTPASTTGAEASHQPKAAKKPAKNPKTVDGVVEDDEEIDESTVGVGSIAAGGRYDNLVGSLISAASGDSKKAAGIPCVGVSIGLDRIYAILWPQWVEKGMRSKETLAYVLAAGDGLLTDRIRLVTELRQAGINVCSFFSPRSSILTNVNFASPIISRERNPSYLLNSLLARRIMCRS